MIQRWERMPYPHYNSEDDRDEISFSVDKSIRFVGATFYGHQNLSEFTITLQLLDTSDKCLAEIPTKSYKSNKERGYEGFRLCFDRPVRLDANKIYNLLVRTNGRSSYFCVHGRSEVLFEGYKFNFHEQQISRSGRTTVLRGNIPELMFYI